MKQIRIDLDKRLEIYKRIQEGVIMSRNDYCCPVLIMDISNYSLVGDIIHSLPELLSFKPDYKNIQASWFNTKQERLEAIQSCIDQVELKISKRNKKKDGKV